MFYYQCRDNGEKEGLEEGTRYKLVSPDLHVNDSLPRIKLLGIKEFGFWPFRPLVAFGCSLYS